MLQTLQIKNFALFSSVMLDFSSGITIFTGETGAGKSLLMDAVGMLAGNRATGEYIRQGEDSFFIEGVFSYHGSELRCFMEEHNIPIEEDSLIISRRFTRSGKGNILANGVHITRSVLQQLASYLLDIHDQFNHYSIFNTSYQREILDSFDMELQELADKYRSCYGKWQRIQKELQTFYETLQSEARQRDILSFQLKEISEAALRDGEDSQLEKTVQAMRNSEKIQNALTHALTVLGEGKGEGVVSKLRQLRQEIAHAANCDSTLNDTVQQLETIVYELEDIQGTLCTHQDQLETESGNIDCYEQRLYLIQQLKRKYGSTIQEILQFSEKAEKELAMLDHKDETIEQMEAQANILKKELWELSGLLQKKREIAGNNITERLEQCLVDLGMAAPRLSFCIVPMKDIQPFGAEHIELFFSSNPGEPPKPLGKISSGGEASRIALALKCIMTASDNRTIILDEIDVGISGDTAIQVAYKIRELSQSAQVFCITHLPQTAAAADDHFYLYKEIEDGRTYTRSRKLTPQDHIEAIASIFVGAAVTEESKKTAAALVEKIRK